jgi:hypothetical protein
VNRRWTRWLPVGCVALFAIIGVREWFEPYLLLRIPTVLGRAPEPTDVVLQEGLALRAYADTRPHIGKIDELQKGMVLAADGVERIEEGFGFGLPIVRYEETTYMAREAEIGHARETAPTTLVKRFELSVADHPVQFLTRKYHDVASRGSVVVTYTVVAATRVAVEVDLSGLEPGWREAFLMNEQGAKGFTRYQDDQGEIWRESPGIWDEEKSRCGCWIDPVDHLRFCVETAEPHERYIGRERYHQYSWAGVYVLSWSGIDLHLTPGDPVFGYTLHIERLPPNEEMWRYVPCS